ncbi:MAG: hypothetical protein H7122_00730 [Chitinophagaceae bacterium]|nr:hypothetical protein [Chitinophagaceae bacterium]
MQIGIFETVHFEGAYPVIKLFDNGHNEITIFTYETSYQQFEHLFKDGMHKYNWIVKQESESKYEFIVRLYKISKKSKLDILYINTISDNHILYAITIALLRKAKIIVTLHDINSHFDFEPGLSIRKWIRYIGKRSLIKAVNDFNVVSSTMVTYLKNKLPSYKKVHCVPGSIFEQSKRPASLNNISGSIHIVIPGTIDQRRRNYELVFDLLDEINQKKIDISIVLLGGINEYGKDILDKCKQYISKTGVLKFFQTDIVDQPVFDNEMDEAHFILIPSVIDTVISDGIRETYGLSISSGTIFDVIKHAKPFIIPEQLAIPDNLESSCFKYSAQKDIIPFLESFLANPEKYSKWKRSALQNSQEYTIENIRKGNAGLFL